MSRPIALLLIALTSMLGLVPEATPITLVPATSDPDLLFVPAGAPLPVLQSDLTSDPSDDDTFKPAVSPAGGSYIRRSTNSIVLRVPAPPQGPASCRHQVGHWKTDEVPPELHKLVGPTGAIWDDLHEVDVNMDIGSACPRSSPRLASSSTCYHDRPRGYVADAFLALHVDSDGVGELSGFKMRTDRCAVPLRIAC